MGKRRVAVVGAGMTKFVRRAQETGNHRERRAVHLEGGVRPENVNPHDEHQRKPPGQIERCHT